MHRVAAIALAAFASTMSIAMSARADVGSAIVVWPTLTPAGDDASITPLHKPKETEGATLARAQELDATLRDAAQDLGYTLDVADPGPATGHTRDADLVERAARTNRRSDRATTTPTSDVTVDKDNQGTWVVSARLEPTGSDSFIVRIVAVPPLGRVLRVREETVKGAEQAREQVNATAKFGVMNPIHSPGRAVLAVNGALFGAFAAYGIQRSSGSDDPRLLYPLLALGTGIGIGATLLVADEWDIGTGDAWILAGGAWWGAGAGILIANGRHIQPLTDRYSWGIGGGVIGIGLSTFALTRSKMDEGDATLVHSGATLGFFAGGVAELLYRGTIIDTTPYTGAGYGAAIGLVAAGALATQIDVSAPRMMYIDLGAALGALGGAAAASPLIFGDAVEGRTRAFLATTLAGTLVGGGVAWFATRNAISLRPERHAIDLPAMPFAGVIGQSVTSTGNVAAYGVGAYGSF
jgi:hypothetical protein